MTSIYSARHPRLHAFYESAAMNMLMIGMFLSIMSLDFLNISIIPAICCISFLIVGVIYTLWYWTGKTKQIKTSKFLSYADDCYFVYFLIVTAMRFESIWWFICAAIAAAAILLIFLIRKR